MSQADRIGRIERVLADRPPSPLATAGAVIATVELDSPNCPLATRWRAGELGLASMIVLLGPGLVPTVTEAELRL